MDKGTAPGRIEPCLDRGEGETEQIEPEEAEHHRKDRDEKRAASEPRSDFG